MSTGSTGSILNLLRVTDAVHADAMIKYCTALGLDNHYYQDPDSCSKGKVFISSL